MKAVYKTYIDVIHFRKTDKRKLHERDSDRYFCISKSWLLAAAHDQFLLEQRCRTLWNIYDGAFLPKK